MEEVLVQALKRTPLFAKWDVTHLHCVQSGEEVCVPAGEIVVHEGDPAHHFYLLLAGQVRITKNVGGANMILATYSAGTFFGEVPLLLDTPFIATGYAVEDCRLFRMDRDAFWNLLRCCPTANRVILQTMARRVMDIQIVAQQQEKLLALGTLSAGLAHEINNPAASAQQAAADLSETLQTWQNRARALHRGGLSGDQKARVMDWITEAADIARMSSGDAPLSILAQSEREETMLEWLEAHDIVAAYEIAPTFAESGITLDRLDALAAAVPIGVLEDALCAAEAVLRAHILTRQVQSATNRVSALVEAVKDYTYMDQAPVQEIDVTEGLENTLTMLGYDLRGIAVLRDYAPDLPRIQAYGSELNQVWTHLLNNAIDAIHAGHEKPGGPAKTVDAVNRPADSAQEPVGHLTLRTRRERDTLLVEIEDDGRGIPPDIQARIYEPFFTTKTVGKGLGLGLDIARRIVIGRHKGDIQFQSHPGATTFRVWLPVALDAR